MRSIQRILGVLLMAGMVTSAAQAVTLPSWNDMPVACTPARMQPWQEGLSEEAQAPCHCPPPGYCPTAGNAAAFLNNDKLPPTVTMKCCQPPKCAAGTFLAGQPVPANGDCDRPPSCENGFVLIDFNGPFSPGLGQTPGGNVTIDDVCAPPCDGNYIVIGNGPLWGGDGGMDLDEAWDMESVPYGRYMHNGQELLIACEQVVVTNDCFHGSSKVTLADGKVVAIETLKVGDLVKGPNGNVRVAAVNQLTAHAVFYRINEFDFRVTGEHPLQTKDGWKAASPTGKYDGIARLAVGDVLLTEKGEVAVKSVVAEKTKQPERSINIQIKDDAPFYVDGVAVKPFKDMQFTY